MKKLKVFVLVYRVQRENIEFLALRNNPADPAYGGDFWYVVTGNVEPDEEFEVAARRELAEETGIENITQLVDPKMQFHYQYRDVAVEEKVFLVQAGEDVRQLNEENVEYQWLREKDFLSRIKWDDDQDKLLELIRWVTK